MERRRALAIATTLAGVTLAGVAAFAANTGFLGSDPADASGDVAVEQPAATTVPLAPVVSVVVEDVAASGGGSSGGGGGGGGGSVAPLPAPAPVAPEAAPFVDDSDYDDDDYDDDDHDDDDDDDDRDDDDRDDDDRDDDDRGDDDD